MKAASRTDVVPVRAVQVVRLSQGDVRVGDDARVVQEVGAGDVGEEAMEDEDVALLGGDGRVLLAVLDVGPDVAGDGRVQALGVVV